MDTDNNKKHKCIYCGQFFNKITKDHIPPKNLFGSPRPTNLITVPSCFECNNSASGDDEYFRLVCTMRHDVFAEGTQTEQLWDKAFRGISINENRHLRRS